LWQAYQGAITYQPSSWPDFHDNMASFYIALGLAYKRSNCLKEARAAYNAALPHIAQLPPGEDRDHTRGLLLQNMRALKQREDLFEEAERVVQRSGGLLTYEYRVDAEGLAAETRAQMHDPKLTWMDLMKETREAVRAVRATRASDTDTAARGGEGEAGKARRQRRRRQRRRKHKAQGNASRAGGGDAAAPTAEEAGEVRAEEEAAGTTAMKECSICYEGLDPDEETEPLAALPCAHLFHCCCIQQWFATCALKGYGKTCPYCRAECPSFVLP
jgi:tetratricopeptide (TPR) repeat protein